MERPDDGNRKAQSPDVGVLPTALAQVWSRFTRAPRNSAEAWLALTYAAECILKHNVSVFASLCSNRGPERIYAVVYDLLHTDGLGVWTAAIPALVGAKWTSHSAASREVAKFLTLRHRAEASPDFSYAYQQLGGLREVLGATADRPPRTVRGILNALVEIRNKTRGHGAVADSFYPEIVPLLESVVRFLLSAKHCSALPICFAAPRGEESVVAELTGQHPVGSAIEDGDCPQGLFIRLEKDRVPVVPLMHYVPDPPAVLFANGAWRDDATADFLDYASGMRKRVSVAVYRREPIPLPSSETAGMPHLDVQGNVWGNLPSAPSDYVERPKAEKELLKRLKSDTHPIITLHGHGGIGKTSLALTVVHRLTREEPPCYGCVIWFSARDVDLRVQGPVPTAREVANLADVAGHVRELLELEAADMPALEMVLSGEVPQDDDGILFVFDNFETFDSPSGLHQFLDEHTRRPNKVLLTSRHRTYPGDFPIEIAGMEWPEAGQLLLEESRRRLCEPKLADEKVRERLWQDAAGHPYVMKLAVAEIARGMSPHQALTGARSDEILDALFRRSYESLTYEAQKVYLALCRAERPVPEFGVAAALGHTNPGVERDANTLVERSLVTRRYAPDDTSVLAVPEESRRYGMRQLVGHQEELRIAENAKELKLLAARDAKAVGQSGLMDRWIKRLEHGIREGGCPEEVERLLEFAERLAREFPSMWKHVAGLCTVSGSDAERVREAYRHHLEFDDADCDVIREWVSFEARNGEPTREAALLVKLCEMSPGDVSCLDDCAKRLVQLVTKNKDVFRLEIRKLYFATTRELLEPHVDTLSAHQLGHLAWLYLADDAVHDTSLRDRARKIASLGREREPNNYDCQNLINRIDAMH